MRYNFDYNPVAAMTGRVHPPTDTGGGLASLQPPQTPPQQDTPQSIQYTPFRLNNFNAATQTSGFMPSNGFSSGGFGPAWNNSGIGSLMANLPRMGWMR